MIKHLTDKKILLATSLFLTACSSQKNDLESKTVGAGTYTQCSGKCVNVEFTNEPLVNVNYACGSVNNVTGNTSQAQCPNQTTLKFFIQGKKTERKVELGKSKIDAINSNNVSQYLMRRTPLDLVKGSRVITSDNDSSVTKAVNMIRFLDAFRVQNIQGRQVKIPYNKYAPVNRTVIQDKFKNNMDEYLSSDVTVEDFASDAFIDKTRQWLASHGLAVTLTSQQAKQQLNQGLNTQFSAVYFQPSLAVSPLLTNVNAGLTQFLIGIGITGNTNNDAEVVNMSIYGLNTRDGGNIGHGLYWNAPADKKSNTQTNGNTVSEYQYRVFYSEPYKKMHRLNPSQSGFNLFNNTTNNFLWKIEGNNQTVDFNQGQFVRNFVVLGNEALKNRYISGDVSIPDNAYGKWQLKNSAGGVIGNGTATISKIPQTFVSSFFDPSIWLGEHVVGIGDNYIFPLHATLTLKYGNGTDDCGESGCSFGNDGKLGITILESGDIITDGSSSGNANYAYGQPDCKASTLQNGNYVADGFIEKRIGTIRASSQRVGSEIGSFINPSILVSGSEFGEMDGLHIGTLAVSNTRVTIDLANLVDTVKSNTGAKASIGIYGIGVKGKLIGAKWANIYRNFDSIRVQNDKVSDSFADKQLTLKTQGQVSIALSDCYSIKKRSQ